MGAVGFLFALFLVLANKQFYVETDPKIAKIEETLPGVNCGGCGYASCAAYAEAVAAGEAAVDLCVVGGDDTSKELASIMGISVSTEGKAKLVAVVFCQGDDEASEAYGTFEGIEDCAAAMYSQDTAKRCKYGCIGLGSCVASCPFDAIHMSEKGIPYVDAEKCTACGNCVRACPRDLIELHPVTCQSFVYCKSHDAGAVARKICKKACIACRLCVKAAEKDGNADAVGLEDNLAFVNTENYAAKHEYGEKCPTDAYTSNRNSEKKRSYIDSADYIDPDAEEAEEKNKEKTAAGQDKK